MAKFFQGFYGAFSQQTFTVFTYWRIKMRHSWLTDLFIDHNLVFECNFSVSHAKVRKTALALYNFYKSTPFLVFTSIARMPVTSYSASSVGIKKLARVFFFYFILTRDFATILHNWQWLSQLTRLTCNLNGAAWENLVYAITLASTPTRIEERRKIKRSAHFYPFDI